MRLKTVFFGTPRFAAYILEYLIEHNIQVVAVVTQPDRPKGRSGQLMAPPVKECASRYQIPVYQPNKASDPEFASFLETLHADLFIVAAYREILKDNILNMPRLGCINVHASLLPKYRGAAPIQRCIMAGEKESGVTIMAMAKKLDTGNILSVVKTPIPDDMTAGELETQLSRIGAPALVQVIKDLELGKTKSIPQNNEEASYAKKLTPEDGFINWNQDCISIHNQIRGVTPKPGAWCWVSVRGNKKRLRILRAAPMSDKQAQPGDILESGSSELMIGCKEGALNLLEMQLEGKKPMSAKEFLQGFPKKALSFSQVTVS